MPQASSRRSNEDQWPIGGPRDVFYGRPLATPLPRIVRAQGICMWDSDGRKYLDVSSGPVVSNIGHGHPAIVEVVSEQVRRLAFSYCRVSRTDENIRLSEMIAELAGPGFERVHLSSGGSEAMDMSLKFARQYACATGHFERTRIISCHPSYHGGTLATMAISGDEEPEVAFRDMAVFSTKVAAPLTYRRPSGLSAEQNADRAADELEGAILRERPERVLAFVIEPVGGLSTGANVRPRSITGAFVKSAPNMVSC
jgi:adenosylmethionine-8-amino-7-oxononanoate aminotransferase